MATKLSQAEWAGLWISQGGDPPKALIASAIVMAESGGRTKIYNGICCWGGYQFNTNTLDKKCAVDPVCATQAAIRISDNGKDWSKWETFTNGNYQQYMSPKWKGNLEDTVGNLQDMKDFSPLGIKGVSLDDPLEALKNIAAFFTGLGELLLTPEGWARLAKLIGGAILVLWGLRVVIKESTGTDPVGTAIKGAELAGVAATIK